VYHEAVTTVILNYESLRSLCCLLNRKVKSFKQTLCLAQQCTASKSQVFEVLHFGLDTVPQ